MPDTDDVGRPLMPFSGDEVETLLGFLDYQRATLEWKCRGLTDDQLRSSLPSTDMTLGGLLKHLTRVEDHWFSDVVRGSGPVEPWAGMPWAAEWESSHRDTGEELRRRWAEGVERSRQVVGEQLAPGPEALGATHSAWGGRGQVSLRWVLVHMVEEYARHNGHADLLRQAIDGQTGE